MDLLSKIEVRPGTLGHISIAHDDDCPGLLGEECECDPDLVVSEAKED